MKHVDVTSLGLCGTSTLLTAITGNGLLIVLTAIGIITTIVYNCINIWKAIKKPKNEHPN